MRAPAAPAVPAPLMIQHWRQMAFLHWRYPPDVVQRLLPDGLRVETFDRTAWVGLLPFDMRGVRPPGLPPLPWLSRFAETNVRTYVRGPEGGSGIFFLSLEAARLPAVLAARLTLRLPYRWAAARVRVHRRCLRYEGTRHGPGGARAGYRIEIRAGQKIADTRLGPLDHFLTARYRLYSSVAGRLVSVDAQHPPWPLYRAEVRELREDLLAAVGLPAPTGAPLVHASPGVRVRIGSPRLLPHSTGAD